MPLIDAQVLEGVFSEAEKRALIRVLTMAFGRFAGREMQDMTSLRIHQINSGHRGGVDAVWTTEEARQLKLEPA
ncbi:MAG TPA: 4-oxalocrotonate tautomerase [Gammaproteobacteria bacterium]|nr:4-oxalocrotonate tautomerase [Gammaproteobacteria bacterium]